MQDRHGDLVDPWTILRNQKSLKWFYLWILDGWLSNKLLTYKSKMFSTLIRSRQKLLCRWPLVDAILHNIWISIPNETVGTYCCLSFGEFSCCYRSLKLTDWKNSQKILQKTALWFNFSTKRLHFGLGLIPYFDQPVMRLTIMFGICQC